MEASGDGMIISSVVWGARVGNHRGISPTGSDLRVGYLGVAALLLCTIGCASSDLLGSVTRLGGILESPGRTDDDVTVALGLKDALVVGTRNAVDRTSRRDGFLGNDLIRIPIPSSLTSMAKALRTVGLGSKVDELEVAMNRTAERATGEAFDVFAESIRAMTFTDARSILTGGATAATEYFRRTAREPLEARVQPIVTQKMGEVGVVRLYEDLVARYMTLPFATKRPVDLSRYVTGKTLDGLFAVLADEERQIRTDPAARVTPLLRQVFGSTP